MTECPAPSGGRPPQACTARSGCSAQQDRTAPTAPAALAGSLSSTGQQQLGIAASPCRASTWPGSAAPRWRCGWPPAQPQSGPRAIEIELPHAHEAEQVVDLAGSLPGWRRNFSSSARPGRCRRRPTPPSPAARRYRCSGEARASGTGCAPPRRHRRYQTDGGDPRQRRGVIAASAAARSRARRKRGLPGLDIGAAEQLQQLDIDQRRHPPPASAPRSSAPAGRPAP